ncbi:hypothetical protein K435DRAFT_830622 [Dendrothele bispora CBS 962.96]|uniref:DDE-1 domain-containing protein n=1 Tax=Dendrothele bispora (strain CBS 962.96) TaxID=1314807 RepID=A0A4S8LHK1_DENBC|nr:hypothetical protein K435DRAFT_830622 [Dendrothele bispora CBS 962.96]
MTTTKPPGIPTELSSRLSCLANYLKHLPAELPLDPQDSSYHFALDPDHVAEEGFFYAANKNLEICFQTWSKPRDWDGFLEITERGKRLEDLVKMLKYTLKCECDVGSRKLLVEKWVERLIDAAKRAGAKIPSKRKADSESDSEPCQTNLTRLTKARPSNKRRITHVISDSDSEPTLSKKPLGSSAIEISDDEAETASPPKPSQPEGLPPLKQTTLFNWGREGHRAKKFSPEELKAQRDAINEKRKEYAEKEMLRQEQKVELKKEKIREQTRARVAKLRANRKSSAGKHGQNSSGKKAKKNLLGKMPQTGEVEDIAELSRPKGGKWKKARTGKRGGVIQKRHARVNWFHPFLWALIGKFAPTVNFSATLLAKILQRERPDLYARLHKGTIQHWLSKKKKRWSRKTLANVARYSAITATGRVGVLTPYPDLVKTIKEKLIGLRQSGISINRVLARSIMLAVIKSEKPELLNGQFKCTEHYVGGFLDSVMSWSPRSGTRAAAHVPEDAPELMERTFFRLVHLVTYYDIPPGLVINMDQTGVIVLMTSSKTYEQKGTRQVDIHGKDEKRAYTICVSSTADGDLLPFQIIWSGKTARSLPSPNAEGYAEATANGFRMTFANSPKANSHYSTEKTMEELVNDLIQPYVKQYIQDHDLPADQKAILYIDCYPVHTGKEFRTFVLDAHPNIFLVFVPANCTSIGQPADVGLQRVLKHHIRQDNLQYLVDSHIAGLAQGLSPSQIKFTTSLPALRDASVKPCVNVYNFFQTSDGRKLVQKAWENCSIRGGFNLSGTCLTHRNTKAALRKYLEENPDFRQEIEAKIGRFDYGDETEPQEPVEILDDDAEDATDVPLEYVVRDALGVDVSLNNQSKEFTVSSAEVERSLDGSTRGVGNIMHEDISLYREAGLAEPCQVASGKLVRMLPVEVEGKSDDSDGRPGQEDEYHLYGFQNQVDVCKSYSLHDERYDGTSTVLVIHQISDPSLITDPSSPI